METLETLKRKIRSLESGGNTDIGAGLLGASALLGDGGGTVILMSDGRDAPEPASGAARKLADRNVRIGPIDRGPENRLDVLVHVVGAQEPQPQRANLRLVFRDVLDGADRHR